MFVALSTVMGGWPIPSCKGVCGYPSPRNEVSQEKGGETGQPGHPTPTAMQSGSSDFKPPHPWGGGVLPYKQMLKVRVRVKSVWISQGWSRTCFSKVQVIIRSGDSSFCFNH